MRALLCLTLVLTCLFPSLTGAVQACLAKACCCADGSLAAVDGPLVETPPCTCCEPLPAPIRDEPEPLFSDAGPVSPLAVAEGAPRPVLGPVPAASPLDRGALPPGTRPARILWGVRLL